ncbi:helix-turn-helix domain-containing protein [Pedobacter petrophilus]|uniref:Helix-turn-helix domain-containing protein n=1 Tax=Pedobacter petrophilus TaxID=1908241 RepID=A0A7K0G593_9SPHI|nr:AraC family transcriptional regulator [Pedobacter petrophilus]MRX78544.1 helix-turn-helix domain-containing protein [Pedobacter petrophilus]
MKTIKFHKSDCGVEILLNVLNQYDLKDGYLSSDVYNTDYFEIAFIKKAEGGLLLNQKYISLSENTILFISPFQKRKWMVNEKDLELTLLIFQEDFLNEFFADKLFAYRLFYFYQLDLSLSLHQPGNEMTRICEMLSEIKNELIIPKPDSSHIIRSLVYYLLQKLNRAYALQNDLSLKLPENNFAYQYKQLLEKHISTHQRIDDYVKMLGLSRISINAAVKKQFNVTATHMLKQRLLFEIKNLLIHANKTVSEIAYDLQFSEPTHLMRFFKKQTQMTIGQFLDEYKHAIS